MRRRAMSRTLMGVVALRKIASAPRLVWGNGTALIFGAGVAAVEGTDGAIDVLHVVQ